MKFYKITKVDGSPCHGGKGKWDLPKHGKPGKWRTVRGEIIPCVRGLHVCTLNDLHHWYRIGRPLKIWEVEIKGTEIKEHNKSVVKSARLIKNVTKEVKPFLLLRKKWAELNSANFNIKSYQSSIVVTKWNIKHYQDKLKRVQSLLEENKEKLKKAEVVKKEAEKLRKKIK